MSLTDWNGRTQYERNQGDRDKAAAEREAADRKIIDERMQNNLNNPGQSFDFYGTNEQAEHANAELSQVGAMTGQNIFQTGQQQQDYYQSLQARRNGDDAVAANMMAGRNRNLANVGRQFAGKGVAGGVAAAGMNTATNTADSEINSQLQKNAKSNDSELWNYVKRNQKVAGEALASGEDKGLASDTSTEQATGALGTVICTELHRQGLMSDHTLEMDKIFGDYVRNSFPTIMEGYLILAAPIVRKMKTSKKFTNAVAFFALPWAEEMAGKNNFRGCLVMSVGLPLCFIAGKFFPRKQVVA
jgi:hypothetical protein